MHLANNNIKIVAIDTLDIIAANVIDLTAETTSPDSTIDHRATNNEQRATSFEKIAAILDAKRSQFFIAVYQRTSDEQRATSDEQRTTNNGIWKKTFPDALMTAEEFLNKFARREKPIWLLGEGLVYYKDRFKADDIYFLDEVHWYPNASKLYHLGCQLALAGQFADPLTLTPIYLRKPDVTEKRKSPP